MSRSQVRPLYPIFLHLADKPCLVAGGGSVALSKARGLLAAGARVTVVAPRVLPALAKLKNLTVKRKFFSPRDLAGRFWLVMAATDDAALNSRIVSQARRRRLWACRADQGAEGDFMVPAVARRGPLTVAMSTGGLSPALARHAREKVQEVFGPEWHRAVALLKGRRKFLRSLSGSRRRRFLQKLLKG